MPSNFTRPTLQELIDRDWADIQGSVQGLEEWPARTVERGAARALAGNAHGLHGHAAWGVDQAFVQHAEREALLIRGDEVGVPLNAASAASGFVIVTGAGGNIAADTRLQRPLDGWTYRVTQDYVGLVSGASISVEAVDGYEGASGNMASGQLSFVSSISGFDSAVTVVSLSGGSDEEDIEDYRDRLHEHLRNPIMGGAPGDHRHWALEVSGVTRAWEYRGVNGIGNPALGRVAITFVCDDNLSSIIPDAGMVEAVRAHVQSKSTALVIVFAPTAIPFNYTAKVEPDTAAVRAAAAAEVADMIRREAAPNERMRLSDIEDTLSIAPGVEARELISPTVDPEPGFGEILVPGTAMFEEP